MEKLHDKNPKALVAETIDDELGNLSFAVFSAQAIDIAVHLPSGLPSVFAPASGYPNPRIDDFSFNSRIHERFLFLSKATPDARSIHKTQRWEVLTGIIRRSV